MTNVDARLLEMLRASAGDTPEPVRQTEQPGTGQYPTDTMASDAWCRENPSLCYGRGPTGRLRNFRAMNDTKLRDTFWAVEAERNDPTALEAIRAEMTERGLL